MKFKSLLIIFSVLVTSSAWSQQQIVFSQANDGVTYELTNCNGFIIDAGGQGGPGYDNNQDVTITICPPAGSNEIINIQFPLFDLDDPAGPNNGDFMEVFDGADITAPSLGVYTNNDLQGSTVQATNLNPSGCLTFRFTSDGSVTGAFAGNATCTAPCENPTALATILNAPAPDSIAVCVGETVDFADNGSFAVPPYNIDSYSWDFMDGTTATGPNVSHQFDQPGQYTVNLTVDDDNTDSDPCVNLNSTELKVYVTTYPTFDPFPGDTTLCVGEQFILESFPDQYDSTWVGFPTATTTDEGCLYDSTLGVPQVVSLPSTGFVAGSTITSANDIQSICIDMEHSFMGDLVVQIQCPTGQTVTLHQQGGGGTYLGVPIDNGATPVQCSPPYSQPANLGTPFTYCFTPTATQTWVDWVNAQGGFGLTLPAGNYASVNPLDGLIGCPANGTWQIIVTDNWAADDGNISGFSLNLDPSFYPTSNQFTPHIGSNVDSSFWVGPFGPEVTNTSADGNSITVAPTSAGNYQYTYQVTNNFGCSFDSTVNIVVEQGPIADAGPDLTGCPGDLVQLDGGIGGGNASCTYVLQLDDTFGDGWNGNSVDITVNGTTNNYTVPTGSQSTFNISVNHGDPIDIQFDDSGNWDYECEITIFDANGNVVYQDGQGGGTPTTAVQNIIADCFGGVTFNWMPAAGLSDNTIPNPDHTISGNQTYTLEVFPIGHPDCATMDDMEVILNITDYAGEDSTAQMCTTTPPMDLFNYVVGANGNVPVTTGEWHDAGSNVITMPFDPATQAAGDYYYIAGIGAGGCPDTATITVVYSAAVNLTVDVTDSDCGADNGEVEVNATGGSVPYNFSINGGSTQTDSVFSGLQPGNTYTFDVVDALNCMNTIQATIDTINIPAIQNVNTTDASCNTICDGSVEVTATNATQYEVVGSVAMQGNNIMDGLCAGNFDVVAHNDFGCADTTQVTINEPPAVVVQSISNDTSICPGDEIDITAEGASGAGNGYTYNWTLNGNPVGNTQTITVTPTNGVVSTYCVEIGENCASPTASQCMNVATDPEITPDFNATLLSGCSPFETQFANTTNDPNGDVTSYNWSFGGQGTMSTVTPDTVDVTFNNPGVYDVSLALTTTNGCVFETTYQSYVEAFSVPNASLYSTNNPASMFEPEIQYMSNSTGNQISHSWTFEEGDPSNSTQEEVIVGFPEGEPGEYLVTLTVVDANGCTDEDSEYAVINNDLILYAPNAFTPDGDNHNETWRVFIQGINFYDFNLMIFNRWGEPVWESNNAEAEWDGRYLATGEKAPDGVYVWRITCRDAITDKKYDFNGHITILK